MCLRLIGLLGFLNCSVWHTQMYKLIATAAAAQVTISLPRCKSATLTALILLSLICLCSSIYALQPGVESKTHNITEHQRNEFICTHVKIHKVNLLQPCYHKLIYSCVRTHRLFLCVVVFVCCFWPVEHLHLAPATVLTFCGRLL